MRVAILPYGTKLGLKLAGMPFSDLHWPFGAPDEPDGCVGDLTTEDHLIIYPGSRSYYMPRLGVRCRVSVMIVEPEAVHRRHMTLLRGFYWRFHRILTCNENLLAAVPNGQFFPFGSTWVSNADNVDTTKARNLSLIASSRRTYEGHRLRHEIVDWLRGTDVDADIMGRGYKPFDRKSTGWRHIVIR